MSERPGVVEVRITCGSAGEADAIAGDLVEARLAACVHVMPIRSTYRWRGAVEHDDEVLVTAMTTRDRYAELERLVLARHSYDLPAITAVAVVAGSADYLAWVVAETAEASPDTP
jgi:periplasmic divalent cation tolerance protein